MPLGARGMYQRRSALERPASDLFGFYDGQNAHLASQIGPVWALLPETAQKPSLGTRKAGEMPEDAAIDVVGISKSPASAPGDIGTSGGRVPDTFDFVVVGGGSGGCAVAGRLSEDPRTSVALLEAGGAGDNWVVTTPGALALMVPSKLNNWAFDTVPQASLNGRVGYQPRGKGLGGSSAINAMVYIRGHRSDYDQWASLGNAGWSYADVLPYFKRSEDNADFDGEYHGKGGPLAVNKLRTDNPVQQTFLQAAREAQFRIREDFNTEDHEGLGVYQVTQRNGERWSAARAYVHPHMATRANLRVETHAQTTRILFEGKRAVGVEYRQGEVTKQMRARREVILSSGAFQTPQLLFLSGVGDRAALAKHGIATTHHLPGVGQNLQDHPDFIFAYLSDSPYFTGMSFSGIAHQLRAIMQYRRERRGPMTSNFAECGGFLKTSPDLDVPDIQLHFGMAIVDDHGRQRRSFCRARDRSEFSWAFRRSGIHGRGLQDHAAADGDAGAAGIAEKGNVYSRYRDRRRHPRAPARARRHRVSPGRHRQDGHRCSCGGRSETQSSRAGRPAHRRCLGDADPDRRQHQRADHHDRREGRGYDQGGAAGELIFAAYAIVIPG